MVPGKGPTASPALNAQSPAAQRMPELLRRLHLAYPDAGCALDHTDALQLLVATILSAQCTDERVNQVTPALFARYPDAEAFARADSQELEEAIRSTGFYRQKAKFIQQSCAILAAEHGGHVPDDMVQLLELPGVARKTANVVLGVAYGKADGVVVDTHVQRLARRLGLTTAKDADKIEADLMALTDRAEWIDLAHLLIFHGRRVCAARKPDCPHCPLADLCPSAQL
jgi:endonuclease-3